MTSRLRWAAIGVFALANALNFMDRQILAALAPELMREFQITAAGFGDVLLAFSLVYALAAPVAGLLIDRVGLPAGASVAVGFWSLAGMATGWTSSLGGLTACRALLGLGESGGVPATGKASALYLPPRERALGSAVFQGGLTLGAVLAPLLAQLLSRSYGWRSAFVVLGAAGFLWIPLWWTVHKRVPHAPETRNETQVPVRQILRDRRYWALLASNALLMSVYSLWVNWTTLFLVQAHHLTQAQANYRLAWVPPIFATAGGVFGGWLTLRWSGGAEDVTPARMRAILAGSLLLLGGAAVPFMPTPGLAVAFICLSYFACVASSVNIYALPLDLFGSSSAGFAVSGLTSVYGLLQGVFSAIAGRVVDRYGFTPLCVVVALLPMASWLVLHLALKEERRA
ncbi:MAG: MFS transporter [Acidobacteria bacterium]|nr:MFS transporter [Acidobacteriota bacterium]